MAVITFDLSKNDKLFLSAFTSEDLWQNWRRTSLSDGRINLSWGNQAFNIRYSKILSNNIFAYTSLNYSHFHYKTDLLSIVPLPLSGFTFSNKSDIKNTTFKAGIDWQLPKQLFKIGLDFDTYNFNPNTIASQFVGTDTLLIKSNPTYNPVSYATYINDAITISSHIQLNTGIRIVNYTIHKKSYNSFEPRLSLEYNFGDNNSCNIAYNRMRQFVHLLSSYSASLSNDIWAPATDKIPPQSVQQVSLGYNKQWIERNVSLQLGLFHKSFSDQIDYREGSNFFFTDGTTWEDAIEKKGIGRAFGAELMLKKDGKDWNGWIAYTLSKNERQFTGINHGKWYPQRYDRRHNLNIVYETKMNEKWTFNSNFVFMTGHAVTLPDVVFKDINGIPTAFYSNRNNERMPLYNRLDVSFTKSYKTRKGREAKWGFSLFNTYGYPNAFALDYFVGATFDSNVNINGFKGFFQSKSIFRFIPGVNWSIKL